MVEKEVMDIIQIFSWVATATGVCFAAYYYIMTLRNTERIRKRDMVFPKTKREHDPTLRHHIRCSQNGGLGHS